MFGLMHLGQLHGGDIFTFCLVYPVVKTDTAGLGASRFGRPRRIQLLEIKGGLAGCWRGSQGVDLMTKHQPGCWRNVIDDKLAVKQVCVAQWMQRRSTA